MKKITAILIVAVLAVSLALSACSPKKTSEIESSKSKSHIGDWSFELGEEDDELWKIDVTLREDGTCSTIFLEIENSKKINDVRYDGNYEITEDISQLPKDMISNISRDPEGATDCAFFYDAETDELVASFDNGKYITLTRAD